MVAAKGWVTVQRSMWVAVALCGALWATQPRAATCGASVMSGFGGDLNAVYPGGDGGDGGGGGGGGGGGDGGAGAGAGEGKVLGGLMTMTRIFDGTPLGSALTDSVDGLVTVRICPGDLPILLTLTGQPGAKYFDEGTNQMSDFGPGQVLHVLVDSLDENIGASPLTEAAYRYALNNLVLNPDDVRAGRVPLAVTGDLTGMTLPKIIAANNAVLSEVNRLQTQNMKLTTLKSLPTPIDQASSNAALPSNRYGVAAAVLGGLAKMGSSYIASSSPALATGEQLARDLTDGKLDGFALDGSPAAGTGSPVTYDAVRFPIAMNVGANAVSARFGATTTLARETPITELTGMAAVDESSLCSSGGDSTALLKDGSVTVNRTACGGSQSTTLGNFATQVRLIEGSGNGQFPRTFLVRQDGSVWAWGNGLCGLLGDGDLSLHHRPTPVQLAGIRDITSMATGSWFTVARDSTGAVYAWGLNYLGELGMGLHGTPPGSVSCRNDFTAQQFRIESAVATPTRIPGLSDVVVVAADQVTAYALDKSGNVFQWGLIPTGYNFNAPPPYFGEYDAQPVPAKVTGLGRSVAIAVSSYMKMALAADGTVWGWGPNIIGNFGDGTLTPHLTPTQVPGLSKVVEIAANGVSPFVVLLQDATIRYWGGCCTQSDPHLLRVPTAPAPGGTQFYSATKGHYFGTLPPIRHLKGSGGTVLLYAVDGSLFQFPKSEQEHVFVAIDAAVFGVPGTGAPGTGAASNFEGLWWKAPAGSESGWGINLAHQADIIFATWFTYDLAGKAWWLSMTAAKTANNTYAGTLYQTQGPPFNAVPFSPAAVAATPVGSGTLTFSDAGNGTFAYVVNGIAQTKAITRQVFGPLPTCTFGAQSNLALATNYQDLWWNAPAGSESGWGINFTHQGDTIFATWFTYGQDGLPLWLSVTAPKTGPGTYSGTLYRTTGPAFNAVPFNPAAVTLTSVGTATLTFTNGNSGTFAYSVNGVAQVKPITRQVFALPGTTCQ